MTDFSLSKDERESPLWERLVEHYEARLRSLRASNDSSLDADKTAALRGQIKEVKAFLSLGDEQPSFTSAKKKD